MLKGAGIHQQFGWKPVGKYEFTVGAASHLISPLPCTLLRTIKIIAHFDLGNIHLRINDAAGAQYSYSNHEQGETGGAAVHTQFNAGGQDRIKLSQVTWNNPFFEILLQSFSNVVHVRSIGSMYTDPSNFALSQAVGFCAMAGPYTSIRFSQNMGADIVGEVQIFESVYAF